VSDDHPACTLFCPGVTVWLTGLPSAGKSTIAHACEPALRARGMRVEVLDGDAVRPHLAPARGYSREDRAVNIRWIGWVAELLARNGVVVLVSAIAPFRDVRDQVRAAHAANGTAIRRCSSAPRWRWRPGATSRASTPVSVPARSPG
jgi:adenylylsulfate kinase